MDDPGGAERIGARFLQPRRLVGDEDHPCVLWLAFQPVLQRQQMRIVGEIDVDERVLPWRGVQGVFQRLEFNLEKPGELPAEVVGAGMRVSNHRDPMHAGPLLTEDMWRALTELYRQCLN